METILCEQRSSNLVNRLVSGMFPSFWLEVYIRVCNDMQVSYGMKLAIKAANGYEVYITSNWYRSHERCWPNVESPINCKGKLHFTSLRFLSFPPSSICRTYPVVPAGCFRRRYFSHSPEKKFDRSDWANKLSAEMLAVIVQASFPLLRFLFLRRNSPYLLFRQQINTQANLRLEFQ